MSFDVLGKKLQQVLQKNYPQLVLTGRELLMPGYGSNYDGIIFLVEDLDAARACTTDEHIADAIQRDELYGLADMFSPGIWLLNKGARYSGGGDPESIWDGLDPGEFRKK